MRGTIRLHSPKAMEIWGPLEVGGLEVNFPAAGGQREPRVRGSGSKKKNPAAGSQGV